MIKSSRKIVAGLLSTAMVLTAVVGLASTASAAYSRNLTVGSRGADVTDLQTTLADAGFLTVSPTGYFGSLTKRALAQWQASVGISPASGYFGPITRAYIASNGAAGGTASGNTSGTPGCPAGAMYNYMTGARCDSTGGGTTSTTEGTLTVTSAASPSNNANILANTDVPVYGLTLKAQLADVTVSRLDLAVAVTSTSGSENPGNFINAIKVWNGSTLVKSWSVGTADFVTGTTSATYYVRLSNLGFVVPKDSSKDLVVSFSTNGGIDNARTVVINGYGTNSLLAVSGNNINSYYDVSSISRTQVFQKPGTSNLTIAADASNPLSQTLRLASTTVGALNQTMETFSVKSDTGDSKITSVSVQTTASNTTGPTALYLYDGTTLLGSYSFSTFSAYTAQTATFNNLSIVVPKDVTKTLTVSADFNTSTLNGTFASTTVSSVTYNKPNGTAVTSAVAITGNNQYLYQVSPQWTLLSASLPSPVYTGAGNNQVLDSWSTVFSLKATPVGGTMTTPVVGDFAATISSSTGAVAATVKAVDVVGTPTVMAEGAPYTVNVTVTAASTTVPAGTNVVKFNLTQAKATINGTPVVQTWGLSTFSTPSITVSR